MKKVRKGKKMLISLIIAIITIIVAIVIIVNVVNKNKKEPDTNIQEEDQIVTLPETTTESGMDAENISMQYLKENDQTMITMRITNNTSAKEFNAILIGPDENVLGQLRTGTNTDLDVGEECEISVIYRGDMTATQRIKLEPIQK